MGFLKKLTNGLIGMAKKGLDNEINFLGNKGNRKGIIKSMIKPFIAMALILAILGGFTGFSKKDHDLAAKNNPQTLEKTMEEILESTKYYEIAKGDGYYYKFVDNIDDILDAYAEKVKKEYGNHKLIDLAEDKATMKQILKAQLMTKLPDLGGAPKSTGGQENNQTGGMIVIQPGHSVGADGGAEKNGVQEAELNQRLSGRIVKKLNEEGYKAVITHTTEEEFNDTKLMSQEEGDSLDTVVSKVNEQNPILAMSIHHNSGSSTSTGTELYWSSYRSYDQEGIYEVDNLWAGGEKGWRDNSPSEEATRSKEFAEIVKNHLEGNTKLPFGNIYERDDRLPASIKAPCILYEGGYVSNPTEAAYLNSDEYMEDASNRIVEAIKEFLGDPGQTTSGSAGSQPTIVGNGYGYPCDESIGISDGTEGLNPETYDVVDPNVFHSGFGPRYCPYHGADEIHDGIDLACSMGSPLYSVTDGTVTLTRDTGGYQYTIGILAADGSGNWFFYAHLNSASDILVSEGQKVSKGDLIGYSGNGYGNYAAHLHFGSHKTDPNNVTYGQNGEIFNTDEAQNPWVIIKGMAGGGTAAGKSGKNRSFGENDFQGAIILRRVSPDKRKGVADTAVAVGETTAIEGSDLTSENTSNSVKLEYVKTWGENSKLIVEKDAILYDYEEGRERPKRQLINGFQGITIPKQSEVTYTGKFRQYINPLDSSKGDVYVEVKYKEYTGYISVTTVVLENNSGSTAVSSNAEIKHALAPPNEQTENQDKTEKEKLGDANKVVIALSAGGDMKDANGTSNQNAIQMTNNTIIVAQKVEELLKETFSNVEVIQTGHTNKNSKKSTYSAYRRAENARNANPKPDLCIEIQFNSDNGAGGTGIDAIFKEGDGRSQELAEKLAEQVSASMQSLGIQNNGSGTDMEKIGSEVQEINNYVEAKFPSAIIKGGYIDGPEGEKIKTKEGRNLYAQGIVNAISEYFKSSHQGYESRIVREKVTKASIKSEIATMEYVPPEEFEQKLKGNSQAALNLYTFDEDLSKVRTTSYNYSGSLKIRENSPMNLEQTFNKYSTPYEYMLFYYQQMDDADFPKALAQKIIEESEFVVALQDNTETISTNGKTGTETCSTSLDVTFAQTWFVKAYKESSYSSTVLGFTGLEDRVNTAKLAVPGNATWTTTTDEEGNTTTTLTCKYDPGETTVERTNTFAELYNQYNLQSARPDWLIQNIEMNEKTEHLANITRYLFYIVTGRYFGVDKIDFEELYKLEHFENVNFVGGIVGSNITEKVWFALKALGYSEIAIAGAMGNIHYESGSFDPGRVEDGYDESIGGIGICQWTNYPRYSGEGRNAQLKAFAASKGKTWQDEDIQVEFLVGELTPGGNGYASYQLMDNEGYTPEQWINAQDINTATEAFCWTFERPSFSAASKSMKARQNFANMYYEMYKGKTAPAQTQNGAVYYQSDYPNVDFGKYGTLATDGCGPTSMAMCISDLTGQAVDPPTAWNWCNGEYATVDGISWAYFGAAAAHFGLQCQEIGTDSTAIVKALQEGKRVISSQAKGKGSVFPEGSGHIIYLTGIDSSGKISIKDPNKSNADKVAQTWDPNQIAGWSANNWAIWK